MTGEWRELLAGCTEAVGPELRVALQALTRFDTDVLEGVATCEALLAASIGATEQGEFATALRLADLAEPKGRDAQRVGLARLQRAIAELSLGDPSACAEGCRVALLEVDGSDALLEAELHAQRGVALKQLGARGLALASYHSALDALGSPEVAAEIELLATVHNNMAVTYLDQQDRLRAIEHLQKGMTVAGSHPGLLALGVYQRVNLGFVLVKLGRNDEAVDHLEAAAAAVDDTCPTGVRLRASEGLATARRIRGRLDEAAVLAEEVVAYWSTREVPMPAATAHLTLGSVYVAMGDPRATAVLNRAAALGAECGSQAVELDAAGALASWHASLGDFEEACRWHRAYQDLQTARFDAFRTRTVETLRIERQLEHREQENELLRVRTVELESVVRERTGELRERNAALARAHTNAVEATRAKSTFLALISHELRTPLNGVIGYAELLGDCLLDEPPDLDDAQADIGRITQASRQLLGLIDRILSLTDLESTSEAPRDVDVDVAEALARCVSASRNPSGVHLAVQVPPLSIAREHLLGSVRHVLDNALEFGDGRPVTVSAEVEGTFLVVTIRDEGFGMPADSLTRLSAPFAQHDMSPTRIVGGLGLGLALTRHHVRLLGGTLSAEASPGEGTLVRVTVPVGFA